MASNTAKCSIYRKCADKHKLKLDFNMDDSTINEIGQNYRVLPTFEKSMFEHVFVKYCSLQQNEKLNCHWQAYVKNIEFRVFAPFQFPSDKDLHISKNSIRFLPGENRYKSNNRMRLKAGPGIDDIGQLPIPQELLYNRHIDPGKISKKLVAKTDTKKRNI